MTDRPQHDASMAAVCDCNTRYDGYRHHGRLVRSVLRPNGRIRIRRQLDLDRMGDLARSHTGVPKRCLGRAIPRLPASYYTTHPFENGGRLYDYLGVRWYRRLLRRILWSVNPALLRSQPAARQTMIRATQAPESGHLIIFIVILGITLWPLISGWWDTVAWLLLFNVLHNAYPVLSLRQVRARLNRRRESTA